MPMSIRPNANARRRPSTVPPGTRTTIRQSTVTRVPAAVPAARVVTVKPGPVSCGRPSSPNATTHRTPRRPATPTNSSRSPDRSSAASSGTPSARLTSRPRPPRARAVRVHRSTRTQGTVDGGLGGIDDRRGPDGITGPLCPMDPALRSPASARRSRQHGGRRRFEPQPNLLAQPRTVTGRHRHHRTRSGQLDGQPGDVRAGFDRGAGPGQCAGRVQLQRRRSQCNHRTAAGDDADRAPGGVGRARFAREHGGVAEEPGDPFVGRCAPHRIGLADLADHPGGHQGHLVGHGEGLALVVGDEQRGGAGAGQHPAQVGQQSLSQRPVQGRERLVQQQQSGLRSERAGQGDPLRLAAGQSADRAVGITGQPDQVEQLVDPGADGRARRARTAPEP